MLAYRTTVRRTAGEVRVVRAEEWTYTVRALAPDGVASLEGRLTGLGAGVEVRDEPFPDGPLSAPRTAEVRRLGEAVSLRLGMDGRLAELAAGDFGDSLRHRLLGLRLPPRPVRQHDEWSDVDLVGAFATLLPQTVSVDLEGLSHLLELHHEQGRVMAALESTASARTSGGPAVHLAGQATWDVERGRLQRRHLKARLAPGAPDALQDPGVLEVDLELVRG